MQYDTARNILVYDGAEAVIAATACRSDARRLPGNRVAVQGHLRVLQRLAAHGLKVPAPMARYPWPGRYTPFHAQRITANWLTLNPRGFVLSDMGTGKTLAALWAADYIMSQHPPGTCRALIVAPLSTLDDVWGTAIFRAFLGRRSGVVLHGSAEKRMKRLAEPHDFYIINPDGVGVGASFQGTPRRFVTTGFAKALSERPDINIVIVDEVSAYRDAQTLRHKVMTRLLTHKTYFWAMTGTPTPNGPLDAYGLAKLVNNAHGESYKAYQDRTMLKIGQFKWVPRHGAMESARKLLQPAVRFSIEDCMDLPPCTVQSRHVDLSPDQKKAYADFKRSAQLALKSGKTITAVNEGVLRLKLLQIACGVVYDGDRLVHEIDASPRVRELLEVIDQCNEKIIIFAPFTSAVKMLYKRLDKFSREVINGEVTPVQRKTIFRDFQEAEHPRILIADPGTMAHGLTLTAASTIIWYAPTDKTEIYLQANKRIDRPGQVHNTTIVQLASTPVEKEIYKRLDSNESMQGVLMKLIEDKNDTTY